MVQCGEMLSYGRFRISTDRQEGLTKNEDTRALRVVIRRPFGGATVVASQGPIRASYPHQCSRAHAPAPPQECALTCAHCALACAHCALPSLCAGGLVRMYRCISSGCALTLILRTYPLLFIYTTFAMQFVVHLCACMRWLGY